MKMKKLISTIAALAITGSAFTGMTVVNAEVTEVDFIGSSTAAETFDGYTGAGWSSDAGAFETFTGSNLTKFGLNEVAEVAKGEIGAASTYPTYVSGAAIGAQGRNAYTTTTYTLAEAVRNGVVYFNTDAYAYTDYVQDGAEIRFKDATGGTVATLRISGGNNTTVGDTSLVGATTDALAYASSIRKIGTTAGFHIDTTIDLDNNTMTLAYDSTDVNSGFRAVDTMEVSIADGSNIASIELYTATKRSSHYAGLVIDNTQLYALTEAVELTETTVTINKVDTDGNDLGSETVTGVVAGDPYEATDAQKSVAAVEADGVKYVYTYVAESSTDSIESLSAVAADNVLTLVFSKAAKNPVSSVTVNYNADGATVLSEPKTVTGYEDDVVGIGFKKYILVDGTVYESTKGTSAHYVADTKLAEGAVVDITVAAKTVTGTPVVLVEGSGSNGDNAAVRASEGEATRGLVSLGTVEPGVYSIEAGSYRRGGDTWLYLDGVQLMALNIYANAWGVAETTDITITTAGELTAGPGESSSDYIDYLLLTKTGDVTVDPSEPPVDPSEPPVDPSEPPVDPSEPPVDPSEPPVDPSEPPVEATPDPDSPYASGNLITNGDFTNGTTDWTNAADGGEYAGTISDNAEYIHGNGKALTNTASAGANAASTMRRFVPVEAGKTYYLSFYAYYTGTTPNANYSMMSAFVPVVGTAFGTLNGITLKDYVEYGGQNSWSEEPQSEIKRTRSDIIYTPGMNHMEYTITIPEGVDNIMLSMFAWSTPGTLYFSDFELYELKPEKTLPEVTVEEFGSFDDDAASLPAKAFLGTFTVTENNYAVSAVTWTVADKTATSVFLAEDSVPTVISGGTIVTGLVVTATELSAIPMPTAVTVAAE